MKNDSNSYKQILKATSLFGGVHFFNLIISVIRTKIIAALLGPVGVGVSTLLNTVLNVLYETTSIGLESSGIKSISEIFGLKDEKILVRKILVFKKLIFITAIFGAISTLLSSSFLSKIVFGNNEYRIAFVWISLALLFKQLTSGNLVILQSLEKLKLFAKTNLLGNFLSLLVTVPMYFSFGIDAIAPAIFISSILSFVASYYFSKNLYQSKNNITLKKSVLESKEMIYLGLALGIAGIFRSIFEYLVQMGINYEGGVAQVGLYGAGLVVLNSYVGLIFIVMSKSYFPKLSAISKDTNKIEKFASEQSLVSILLITPIIMLFFIFVPWIDDILFSKEFAYITPMISWGIIGMLFKSLSWSLGYIIIAKGDSKLFIKAEVGFSFLYALMLLFGYYLDGLNGVGIAYFIYFVCHFIGIKIIVSINYRVNLKDEVYKVFITCVVFCIVCLFVSFLENVLLKYTLMIILTCMSIIYVLNKFNKKVSLKEWVNLFLRK